MSEFEREERYIVFKTSKLHEDEFVRRKQWLHLTDQFVSSALVNCVVIEHDWPEFEPVWAMLKARMTGIPVPDPAREELMHEIEELKADLRSAKSGPDRWINSQFRTPPDGESVWCFGSTDGETFRAFLGYRSSRGKWFEYNNGDYIDGGYGNDYEATVTHWQSTPQPPTV